MCKTCVKNKKCAYYYADTILKIKKILITNYKRVRVYDSTKYKLQTVQCFYFGFSCVVCRVFVLKYSYGSPKSLAFKIELLYLYHSQCFTVYAIN